MYNCLQSAMSVSSSKTLAVGRYTFACCANATAISAAKIQIGGNKQLFSVVVMFSVESTQHTGGASSQIELSSHLSSIFDRDIVREQHSSLQQVYHRQEWVPPWWQR